jgi:NAD(P)-dependent dehydrogenase (short-subunit alcohol dehydrogenase family)
MTDFVLRENCGFAVAGLGDIRGRIDAMTDAEYAEMRRNAIRVGTEMRRGDHIRAAVEKVLKKLQQTEDSADIADDSVAAASGNALIIFTREPEPGKTKTRLMPYFSPNECAELHRFASGYPVCILINSAGFGVWGEFPEVSLRDEMKMLDVNVRAVHILTKLFLNDLLLRGSGYIMNVSSAAAFMPWGNFSGSASRRSVSGLRTFLLQQSSMTTYV